MSAVVYRAPDRELNLNESDKSWWRNTQAFVAGLCVGEANRRRDRVGEEKKGCSPLIKFKKMAKMFFCLVGWNDRRGKALYSPLLLFFYEHCFIDKGDLLRDIQGKWRGYPD